jgi:uncharacterized protein (DUF58 family)
MKLLFGYTPTTRLLWLWLVPVALGAMAGFIPPLASFWLPLTMVLCGVSLADGLLRWPRPRLQVQRNVHHSLPVSTWCTVKLLVENQHTRPLRLLIQDRWGATFTLEQEPAALALPPGRGAQVEFRIMPTRRGGYRVDGVDTLVESPLGLWRRRWFLPCQESVKVLPNFRELGRYTLLATHHQLSQMGIRKLSRRGEGKEFHQLREYRVGDTLQQIDWKATARYRRPISKEYQDERDQQVVFILDCGRRMRHVQAGRSQFDHALNATLLLAHVAARQGDAVGIFTFGGSSLWRPPVKQADAVRSLISTMYGLEASSESADYLKATGDLLARQRRRALMVVITNSRSEEHDDLQAMVRQLRRKHLVVVADLREEELEEQLKLRITDLDQALRYQALLQYCEGRRRLIRQLQHSGCFALDVTAEHLPASLVNTYLDIKGRGIL